MKVRSYVSQDSPYLKALLRENWGSDPWTLGYYRYGPDSPPDSPSLIRTVVAEESGRPVGFGTAWTNPFHPHALYVGVNVQPASRGQGFGTRLLEALTRLNANQLPLQGSTWETSADGIRFLERNGFAIVRRTWQPILHVADVDVAASGHFEERCTRHGYSLVSLTDLMQSPNHEEKVAALVAEVYTAAHSLNPPRSMNLEGWIERLRKDPPVKELTFLALHDGQCVGISTAHADEPNQLTIGWSGVREGHRANERDILLALTLRQVVGAARRGATAIQGEFDSTNRWAMWQMGAFAFRPAPCWITFQRTP